MGRLPCLFPTRAECVGVKSEQMRVPGGGGAGCASSADLGVTLCDHLRTEEARSLFSRSPLGRKHAVLSMAARWRYGIGNEFAALPMGGEIQAERDEIFGEEKKPLTMSSG